MNSSSQSEPLESLFENARKGSSISAGNATVPFGLKTRVLAELKDMDSYDRLSFWRRSSLAFTGLSLVAILFLVQLGSDPKTSHPTAAILPLPALDLGEAPSPVK